MSGHDDLTAITDPVTASDESAGMTRRTILRGAATAGIAAGALAATSMPAALAATRAADRFEHHEVHPGEPIVAHLRDARTGEVDIFRGTSQVRLHDRALAAALIRASK
jgi:hypothetical protein